MALKVSPSGGREGELLAARTRREVSERRRCTRVVALFTTDYRESAHDRAPGSIISAPEFPLSSPPRVTRRIFKERQERPDDLLHFDSCFPFFFVIVRLGEQREFDPLKTVISFSFFFFFF